MWPFRKKIFVKTIKHKDWRDYDGDPGVLIPPKEHKSGKSCLVEINGPSTVYWRRLIDGSIMVYRGLKIWHGTEFSVVIKIAK